MKTIIRFSAILFLGFFMSCMPPQQQPSEDYTYASNQDFYDALSPYGHWIQRPNGEYVWIPEAGPDFVPYSTNGYWVWTDTYGWAWASDYSWGWAPFHYGRWDYDPGYGWYWVPDHIWGPAWVTWRTYPGYYGWAPLRPGISIDIALSGGYDPDEMWWTVCDGRYFGRRDMRDHYEHHNERTGRIRGGESRVIGNDPGVGAGKRGVVTGPPRQQVEGFTHAPIEAVKIVRSNKPGESLSGNTWNLYRPQTQPVSAPRSQPAQETKPAQNNTAPRSGQTPPAQPNPTPRTQEAPRSVTTPETIRDLHEQANPPARREAPPVQSAPNPERRPSPPPQQQAAPRQQPAPHQQAAPRQAPPQRAPQQSAPRGNGQPKDNGRPK